MKSLGIKHQILLLTLTPVFLIDLFFTYTHITTSLAQEEELLRSKSEITSRQIAGASEYNLFSGNDAQIRYLLEQTVGSDDIVMAAVYDRDGRLVAESVVQAFRHEQLSDYLYQRQPILSQSIEQSDIFTPEITGAGQSDTLGWVHLYVSRHQLESRARTIIFEATVFFGVILIIAYLLTVTISRRITQPIFALMEHLKQVETGQLGKVIEPTENNEIGAVQNGFNRMTRSLLANRRHLNHRIQQATQQLNEAITDLESKNRELGFARDAAQNASRTKSEFLANMSHEIRTPINGIRGFINLLGQSPLDHVQQRHVDIIRKSTDDLTNIVNEILDFSKMESGKLHIVDEIFDLYEVIEQTRDILFINVLTKNIDLNLVLFSDTPRWLIGDKLRLKQILLNLIGNAIKFTDQGRVVVRVGLLEQAEDSVDIEITVEDTGIGISAEDQENLFQAFSQVETSATRRFAGTGLGLVISKNLATLMGGDIRMQSKPGEGSKFSLQLPFRVAAAGGGDVAAAAMPTALVLAADPICLMETRSLFERAGVAVESQPIDNAAGIEPLLETLRRVRRLADLLVLDLRHLELDLEPLLHPDTIGDTRTIVVDYDRGYDLAAELKHVEFASVVSTSQSIAALLARETPPAANGIADGPPAAAVARRVLLVDDNRVNLTLASELIRLWGHDVVEAPNGSEALELFSRQRFDLIILDIQMPDIDGVSLRGMMRERDPDNRTPIAALTANVFTGEAERLLDLGFDYFLGKPIDEASFRALLDGKPLRRAYDTLSAAAADIESGPALNYDASLELCAGNQSLLRQIFQIVQHDLPEYRQQLDEALRDGNNDRLAAIAHKLQGVTCYASLPRLKRRVRQFERLLERGGDTPLTPAVLEIVRELEAIAGEIEEHLEALDETGVSA
jgi:two-component system sensor histidine kinase BarA